MTHFIRSCLAAWLLSPMCLWAQSSPEDPSLARALAAVSAERLMADVAALSSDAMNGRQAGTTDDERAAAYISEELAGRDHDLPLNRLPMEDSAPVIITQIAPGASMMVRLPGQGKFADGILQVGTDYLPILDSPSVDVQAPIVFVGYGIIDHDRGFDEYTGIDVRNRVVLFLRGKPETYSGQVSHADKVRVAHERGAVAYLTATGPILSAYEARRGVGGNPFAYYAQAGAPALAGAWITTDLAERLVGSSGRSLRIEQQALNRLSAQSRPLNADIKLRWTSVQTTGALRNVGYLLQGSDPERQQETIVLGAHRDHFGNQAGILFAGADDNASGTAVMLEVARALARTGHRPKRSILFLSFSGEEQGLLGSKLYVAHPARPLDRTLVMINIDHAGIGNGRLTVGLTGVNKTWAAEVGRAAGMEERVDLFGYFPGGDHVPFKEAGIPTITIVSGGVHTHFHQPSDMVDTIHSEILLSAARYALTTVLALADAP